MNKYAYVEWLSFATILSDDISVEEAIDASDRFATANYRWMLAGNDYDFDGASYGSGEALNEWLLSIDCPIVFIIPGEKTVVRQVPFYEKEKRHFAKMLPYQLEESIVSDVDSLHFVIGQQSEPQATIAYVDRQWFEDALGFLKRQHNPVSRCMVDFQCLQRADNEIVCWFHDGRLLVYSNAGMGFSTASSLATDCLREVLSAEHDVDDASLPRYRVYLSHGVSEADSISLETVTDFFHTLPADAQIEFHSTAPPLTINNTAAINFCTGEYATRRQNSQQGSQLKIVVILALLSVCLFLAVNFLSIFQSKQQTMLYQQKIEAATRQVVPEGNISNPVRLLTKKLEELSVGNGEPSQVISLLATVAPVIQSLEVELLTINYSDKEKMLRLSVQASSFNIVEKLRADIETKGLTAELLSSNAIDDKFQARLRIHKEKP